MPSTEVRVSVVLNADGSRTVYETDSANRKSTATTTEADGKLREKIRYELGGNGRFLRGDVFGPKEQFRFRALYKYDADGRLTEEIREGKDGNGLGKIVFQYDATGHQTGYTVYDDAGKLLGQTSAKASPASPAKGPSR
jgi:YD repeat-containing protein